MEREISVKMKWNKNLWTNIGTLMLCGWCSIICWDHLMVHVSLRILNLWCVACVPLNAPIVSLGKLNILKSNPKPSTNVKFEVISTCFWSDIQGQLWPLTSFGGSDWIFSILTPNHPLMWNLKSFWHGYVTSEVNFGFWPLLVGQIEYSQYCT